MDQARQVLEYSQKEPIMNKFGRASWGNSLPLGFRAGKNFWLYIAVHLSSSSAIC